MRWMRWSAVRAIALCGCSGAPAEVPAVDSAAPDTPGVDTPADDTPGVDTPAVDTALPPPPAACALPPPPASSGSEEPLRFDTTLLDPSTTPTGCLGADDLDGDGWFDVWWGDGGRGELVVSWGRADGGFDAQRVAVAVAPYSCLMLPDEDGGQTLWLASPSELGGVRPGAGRT